MVGTEPLEESDSNFEWDENSKLYYHASTGFYHDPHAGWYYSSRDGLYYKFENGNYVLIESNQAEDQPEMFTYCESDSKPSGEEVILGPLQESSICGDDEKSEYPPPPSEWLEETLINMYLSGYSNQTTDSSALDMSMPMEATEIEKPNIAVNGDEEFEELEEGEWIPDEPTTSSLNENNFDEDISQAEEYWKTQYDQVSRVDDEKFNSHVVDLWDWALVKETKKDGNGEVARLVGRLMKPSIKLHPSMPSGGVKLRTAPICKVHLDMVQVSSGRIYRLRTPGLQYFTSLPVFDASNPTRDWNFPPLAFEDVPAKLSKHYNATEAQILETKDQFKSPLNFSPRNKEIIYRDRAAERRALYGGFGVGPGQKNSLVSSDLDSSSLDRFDHEEAAAESLSISFGQGSYARKILENMGWKEGEALGCSMRGLIEPLDVIGNKGNEGLGWNKRNKK